MHIPALEGFGLEIVEQVAIPVDKAGARDLGTEGLRDLGA
jgi:hypothetical protein